MEKYNSRLVKAGEEETFLVNPFRCRMWALHDRLDEYVTEETCKAEIDSFTQKGQLIAVLGRYLKGEVEYDVELIYGARRLFIARHLNQPLRVHLREMNDRDALVAMDIENRQRRDISPYERALSYTRWLQVGLFRSQDEIALALQISRSQVSRLLRIARLPSVVIGAFSNPLEMLEGWGLDLAEAWENPERRAVLALRARQIASRQPRLPAKEVYVQMLSMLHEPRRLKTSRRDEVVFSSVGKPLFRVRHQNKSISLSLPAEKLSPRMLDKIKHQVAQILQSEGQISATAQRQGAAKSVVG